MLESGTCDWVIYELKTCGLGDAWTRGRGTHESGTLSHGTQRHGARGREDSPRRGTVSMRTRERKKNFTRFLCLMCKIQFSVVSRKVFYKVIMGTGEKYMSRNQGRIQN